MTSDERVVIVDKDDVPIDVVPRSVMRAQGLRHRTTGIFVLGSDGRLFVQRRTETKDVYPGLLDLCAGGVVVAGESYEDSAVREAQEELGIVDTPLEPVFDVHFEDAAEGRPTTRHWCRVFLCHHDGPFTLQAEEVASGEFVAVPDILADDPARYTPDSWEALRRLLASGARGVFTRETDDQQKDTLWEKLWYPSRVNVFHIVAFLFAAATLVLGIVVW